MRAAQDDLRTFSDRAGHMSVFMETIEAGASLALRWHREATTPLDRLWASRMMLNAASASLEAAMTFTPPFLRPKERLREQSAAIERAGAAIRESWPSGPFQPGIRSFESTMKAAESANRWLAALGASGIPLGPADPTRDACSRFDHAMRHLES